jgi:hypothetical protein
MVGLSAGRVGHGKGQGRVFTDWSRSLESVEPGVLSARLRRGGAGRC